MLKDYQDLFEAISYLFEWLPCSEMLLLVESTFRYYFDFGATKICINHEVVHDIRLIFNQMYV